MLVVDASAILEQLKGSAQGLRLFERLEAEPSINLQAPHVIDLEVAQALRRWQRTAGLPEATAGVWLHAFQAIAIRRHPHTFLLPRIWALRDNLTAYDASYVALAESLDVPLLTADGGVRPARWHSARIEVL